MMLLFMPSKAAGSVGRSFKAEAVDDGPPSSHGREASEDGSGYCNDPKHMLSPVTLFLFNPAMQFIGRDLDGIDRFMLGFVKAAVDWYAKFLTPLQKFIACHGHDVNRQRAGSW